MFFHGFIVVIVAAGIDLILTLGSASVGLK